MRVNRRDQVSTLRPTRRTRWRFPILAMTVTWIGITRLNHLSLSISTLTRTHSRLNSTILIRRIYLTKLRLLHKLKCQSLSIPETVPSILFTNAVLLVPVNKSVTEWFILLDSLIFVNFDSFRPLMFPSFASLAPPICSDCRRGAIQTRKG